LRREWREQSSSSLCSLGENSLGGIRRKKEVEKSIARRLTIRKKESTGRRRGEFTKRGGKTVESAFVNLGSHLSEK